MSDAKQEVAKKLATAEEQLETLLKKRDEAERALATAQAAVEKRKEAVDEVLGKEGQLRGTIGDLKKMLKAFDAVPEK